MSNSLIVIWATCKAIEGVEELVNMDKPEFGSDDQTYYKLVGQLGGDQPKGKDENDWVFLVDHRGRIGGDVERWDYKQEQGDDGT